MKNQECFVFSHRLYLVWISEKYSSRALWEIGLFDFFLGVRSGINTNLMPVC